MGVQSDLVIADLADAQAKPSLSRKVQPSSGRASASRAWITSSSVACSHCW